MTATRDRVVLATAILAVVCGASIFADLIGMAFYLYENTVTLPVYIIVNFILEILIGAASITLGLLLFRNPKSKPLRVALAVIFCFFIIYICTAEILTLLDFVFSVGFYLVLVIIVVEWVFGKKKFYNKFKIPILALLVGSLSIMVMGMEVFLSIIYLLADNGFWLYFLTTVFLVVCLFFHWPEEYIYDGDFFDRKP